MQSVLKRPLVIIVIVALLGVGGGWLWQARGHSKVSFRTTPIKRGEVSATISASGTIEPEEVVDIGAQVAGLIKSFGTDINGKTINYGSIVEEGALLAKIDDSVYAADLEVAKAQMERDRAGELTAAANVDQMKAKLFQATAEWKRMQSLQESKLVAQTDYDTAQANFEVAKANVAVAEAAVAQAKASTVEAQAALDKAERNLAFCIIKSPVRGVVIDRRVNIGQTVVSSLNAPSLFLIAKDLTRMQIWVAVNEADVVRITPGAPVTFICDAYGSRQFEGTVGKVRLNATMTQNVVMYTVEVNTENKDNALLPYLTANVRFMVKKEPDVLLVPNAALRWSPASTAQIAPDARAESHSEASAEDSSGDGKGGKKNKGAKDRSAVVWVQDGEFVRPIKVKTGTSDGANTAVTGEQLQEGLGVVIGDMAANAQANTQNPFVPQIIKR